MADMHREDANYAKRQISCWLYDIEVSRLLTIFLPAELGGMSATSITSPQGSEPESEGNEAPTTVKKRARKGGQLNSKRFVVNNRTINDHIFSAWCIPVEPTTRRSSRAKSSGTGTCETAQLRKQEPLLPIPSNGKLQVRV
jgi:hypothetical protein